MNLRPLHGALAALALVASTSAQAVLPPYASAQVFVNWGQLSIQYFDLDLSDGYSPALTWTTQTSNFNVATSAGFGASAQTPSAGQYAVGSNGWANDWTTQITNEADTDDATANGGLTSIGQSVYAYAQQGAPGSDNRAFIPSARYGEFTLAHKGMILITLPWTVTTEDPTALDTLDRAIASLDIGGYYSTSDGVGSGSAQNNLVWDTGLQAPGQKTGTFSLAVINMSNATTASGYLSSAVSAQAIAQAVPEPETYAMLLAGLGLLGWRLKRRA
jgi:hypothetical protein